MNWHKRETHQDIARDIIMISEVTQIWQISFTAMTFNIILHKILGKGEPHKTYVNSV